jgi:hypothetical protein
MVERVYRRFGGAVLFVVALTLSSTAFGQSTFATVTGTVEDSSGGVLPGTTITVTNQQTGLQRTSVTGERGAYRITELPPGRYTVRAELAGFATQEQRELQLALGAAATLSFKLEVSALEESVTVSAAAPLVEVTRSSVGTSISPEEVDDLPITGRKFIELALLAPGAAPNVAEGNTQSDSISFGGFGEAFKSLWLEGVDINDEVTGGGSGLSNAARHTFSQESVAEFQVIANQYSVEFGRSATGVINILTKSGTNDHSSRGYFFFRDDSFDKKNYFATGEVPFQQQQYGFTYGGPLQQDRMFIFATYERGSSDEVVTVDIPDFVKPIVTDPRTELPRTQRSHNFFAKLTRTLSPSHYLSWVNMYGRQHSDNLDVGASISGDGGDNERAYDFFSTGNITSVFSNNFTNVLRLAYSTYVKDRIPSGGLSPRVIFPSFQYGQATNFPQDRDQGNFIVASTMTYHKETSNLGVHEFKWGAESNFSWGRNFINNAFNGQYQFLTDRIPVPGQPATYPTVFTLRTGDTDLNRPIDNYAFFVEDMWRVTKGLTLSMGLRYDVEILKGDFNGETVPTDIPYDQFVRRFVAGDLRGTNYRAIPRDYNNFGPRIGLAWDPAGNGRMVIRGGAGLFYDSTSSTTHGGNIRLWPGGRVTTYANDVRVTGVANTFFPNIPDIALLQSQGSGNVSVPNATSEYPLAQQFNLGVQKQFGRGTSVAVDGIYMHGLNFSRTINLNARLPNGQYPMFSDGLIVNLADYGNRLDSTQFQFKFDQRFGADLTLRTSYTWAESKTFNSPPVDTRNMDADWGYAANDVRHRFVLSAVGRMFWGLQYGAILTASSAAPYNITTGVDSNGDRQVNERPLNADGSMQAPFSGRGDNFSRVDLRVSKIFVFRGERRVELLWEMFNLLDTVNFGGYDGNQRSTRFAQPRFAGAPFQGQLGIRLDF